MKAMMISETTGDLLDADVQAVVNTVNTVGVMGKGLALQFKRRYPENYKLYRAACSKQEVQLGHMFVTANPELSGPRWIINFPTKGHWRANSKLSDVETGLDDLIRVVRALGIKSIAVPPLGAGNGGLDWPKVRTLIQRKLDVLTDVDVRVFAPSSGHREIRGERTKITASQALLLRILIAYGERKEEIWPGETAASHLEIQKLMYFANRAEPGLKLRFEPGRYGPYSDVVRHLVKNLEGSFVEGFGDGADRTLDLAPIAVTSEGRSAVEQFVDPSGDSERLNRVVDSVMGTVAGLEGPYQLELLATVMWIADEIGTTDEAAICERVVAWNVRKGRLFTPRHVAVAIEHLSA